MRSKLLIRSLGIQPYPPVWSAMRAFTEQRTKHTPDELWLLQHDPVFTQGQAGRPEHILNPHQIPIVQTDRGGQITYHGPGQLVVYPLLDLNQKKISIRSLVSTLEKCVIQMLATYDVKAESRCQAPGVYIENKKICSIGLRVKKGCSFHGIALNIAMDLTPFSYINPCGYKGLEMTQLSHFVPNLTCEQMIPLFITTFLQLFGYTDVQHLPGKIYDL